MSKRRSSKKRYSDPYGKNRPLKVGQERCQTNWCNAAVWAASLRMTDSGKLVCPNCFDDVRIRGITKDWDIKISKHDLNERA